MSKVLKVIKEVCESAFMLVIGGAAGVVSAVGILVLNGFKCLTDNIHPIINVDASKLNLTEIFNDITHHKGSFSLPVDIVLRDENLAPCIDPLKIGLGVGAGVAAAVLVTKYAYECSKQRANKSQEDQSDDYLSINTGRKRKTCC